MKLKDMTLVGILCAALAGGCGNSGNSGGGSSYASEAQGDKKIEQTLEQYEKNSEIVDYNINGKLDLGGNEIYYDAWVLLDCGEVVIWYQGKDDGDHAAEKAILDMYGIMYIQIEPRPEADIPLVMDDVKDVYDWKTGVY